MDAWGVKKSAVEAAVCTRGDEKMGFTTRTHVEGMVLGITPLWRSAYIVSYFSAKKPPSAAALLSFLHRSQTRLDGPDLMDEVP